MSDMPRVSVVVSTYRREAPLQKALDSLLAQTDQNLEIIVADDNADADWNGRVARIAQSAGARHLINEKNLGSAENRNRAARAASGEYLAFLDDDDAYLPQKIEKQLARMLSEKADFGIEDLELVNEDGAYVETRSRAYLTDFSRDALLRNHLMYHLSGTDSMMFRRDYFLKIGGFPPVNLGDEFYLMARAIEGGGKLCYLPEVGARAVVHSRQAGLSSGDSKLVCERALHAYKKQYRSRFTTSQWRYIRMRHYAVIAFAHLRSRRPLLFVHNALLSFLCAPAACLGFLREKRKGRGGV